MRFHSALLCGSILALAPVQAWAGDKVLEDKAPAWVSVADLDETQIKSGPAELLADFQHRLEKGVVYSYTDSAVRIDNPQALAEQNTLTLSWMPDKGDLTVHRLQIYRAGETIDLLANGAEFEVIRREQGLEQSLLDGELTATMSVPGLQVGDVLRTAYTVSNSDQALGDEVQVLQYLGTKPWQVGSARTIVSWPDGMDMHWNAEKQAGLTAPELRDGYRYLTVALPLDKPKDMPMDAPSRYRRPAILRVGSFDGWNDLSSVMAPHFQKAATVGKDSEVAKQAARIMAETSDPLERAAKATRLVQDEVSYLLNGLDGGNYLPQQAEFTWEKRYGDCKAKSVLLLSLLQNMGIEAEPFLVVSQGGDALTELLPIAGDFDHVIVHATIGGQDYWLDGTSTATRTSNIGTVPGFFYGLPLREDGADLTPMTQRPKTQPDVVMSGISDHSAGIDFPQVIELEMQINGAAGASLQAMADQKNDEMLRQVAKSFARSSGVDGGVLSSFDIVYDKEAASGKLIMTGLADPSFEWIDGKLVVEAETKADDLDFNPDRARPEWREIPVQTPGPMLMEIRHSLILPDGGKGFSLDGAAHRDSGFANTDVVVDTKLADNRVDTLISVQQALGEIAPADIPQAKRDVRKYAAEATKLVAPENITWRWDLDDAQRRSKATQVLAAYDKAIDFAAEDDFLPLSQKAMFLMHIYEYDEALAALDQLIDKQPSAWALNQRAEALLSLGRRKDAVASIEQAYDLEPSNENGFYLARQMAYAGEADEALDLLDGLPVGDDDEISYADAKATVVALKGDTDTALSLLSDEVAEKPENSEVLNADCWFRGLFNVSLDDAVSACTRAVERAEYPAAALDSRALVQYRLGNFDAALADLDAVLKLAPAVAESRYMRGIVRLRSGDKAGQDDIAAALRMSPDLAEFYGRHGISPGT